MPVAIITLHVHLRIAVNASPYVLSLPDPQELQI